MATSKLLEAVAVTAELCGRTFTPAGAAMFAEDLSGFSDDAVLKALSRCRREIRGQLTVQDVVSRIDDGRPGVEEAWAMMPFDESQSVVWTDEMSRAFGVALPLLEEGDKVAARMAFKESYVRLVNESRDNRVRVSWAQSLGYDTAGRDAVLSEAVALGRLSHAHAESVCPGLPAPGTPARPALTFEGLARLSHDRSTPAKVPASVIAYREKLKAERLAA